MKITSYKKKDGKNYYKFQVYLGTEETTGKKIKITRSGFISERDAKKEYARLLTEFESGTYSQTTKVLTTYEEVYLDWLPLYKETVKESTFFKTKFTFERHILPRLGFKRIKAINLTDAQQSVNEWSKVFVNFKVMKSYAAKVIEHGQRLGLVENNPFSLVVMPKRKEKVEENQASNFYSKQELQIFLDAMEDETTQWYTLFHLLAYTGIRKGEALALRWPDLNTEKNTLAINKTIAIGEGYTQIIQPPKTSKGKRILNLDETTVSVLKAWKKEQNQHRKGFGYSFSKQNLIFSNRSYNYLSLSAPTGFLERFYKKHPDMKVITSHGMRHTHCSILFEAGASIKEVQDRLGHSDIHTTMNIYAHVTQGKKEETATLFMEYMAR